MKLGIIIDSASGWTRKDAERKGWGYVPIFITINGKEFRDGVDIDDQQFYSSLDINDEVSTAAASPKELLNVYTVMSKKYDQVLYIPLSQPLSSHTSIAQKIAEEFKNIHVLNSKCVGPSIIHLSTLAQKLAQEGIPIKEIIKRVNAGINKTQGMILIKSMDWLKKGGRISKSTAMLGNLLSIIPILYFDGRMEKWGKGRALPKTMLKAAKGLKEILNGDISEYKFGLMHAHNKGLIEDKHTDDKLRNVLKKVIDDKITLHVFPRLLVIHVGLGTYALMAMPKTI